MKAVLCANCDMISNSVGDRCEICGSASLLALGRVLGGSIEGERATLLTKTPEGFRTAFTVLVSPGAARVLQRRGHKTGR